MKGNFPGGFCRFLCIALLAVFVSHNVSFGQKLKVFTLDSLPDGKFINLPVWLYHPGDNPNWAKPGYQDDDWDTLATELNLRDKNEDFFPGIAWFRLHIEIDSSLMNKTFALTMNQRGASQVFHNGDLIKESGTIGTNTDKEIRKNPKDLPIIIHFNNSRHQVLAVRYSHKEAFKNFEKYNENNVGFVMRIGTYNFVLGVLGDQIISSKILIALFIIFVVLGALHFLLFAFFREKKANLFYSIFVFGFSILESGLKTFKIMYH